MKVSPSSNVFFCSGDVVEDLKSPRHPGNRNPLFSERLKKSTLQPEGLYYLQIFYSLFPSVLLDFQLHIFPLNTDHIWPSPVDVLSLFLWQIVGIPLLVHP